MTKHLERAQPVGTCAGVKSRHNGWSPERRSRQAALIRRWAPWRRSTGPITEAGKAPACPAVALAKADAKNALRHGYRSRAYLRKLQRVRNALRLASGNIAALRAFIRSSASSNKVQGLPRRSAAKAGLATPPCPP